MIAAIIQARTGSSRLPNKVMKMLCGKPFIWHVVNRLKSSKKIDKIIIATTINANDDVLEAWATENNILCFRGSETNVLDRFYRAADFFSVDSIIRITADDPFKDPRIIDNVIDLFIENHLDFAYNNKPPTFPEGMDVEIFSYNALKIAWGNSVDNFEKEHVTQYFFRHLSTFKHMGLCYQKDLSYLRWTIDTLEDWNMAELVYARLFHINSVFEMSDILSLIEREPGIALINSHVERSAMYKK